MRRWIAVGTVLAFAGCFGSGPATEPPPVLDGRDFSESFDQGPAAPVTYPLPGGWTTPLGIWNTVSRGDAPSAPRVLNFVESGTEGIVLARVHGGFHDVRLNVSLHSIDGRGGIVYQYVDAKHFRSVELEHAPKAVYYHWRVADGDGPLDVAAGNFTYSWKQWNPILLEVMDDAVRFTMGNQTIQGPVTSQAPGYVGFFGSSGPVQYDDVQVQRLD